MHPHHDGNGLVANLIVCLDQLRRFVVKRGLLGCGNNWSEVVRTFADERSFLDFSARRVHGGFPRVLVEFGVRDGAERHVVGLFDAEWDVSHGDFLRIESIVLEGALVDIDVIASRMTPYLNLPVMAVDMVALAEAA